MIGSFGKLIFDISEKNIVTIDNEINRSRKAKISEHNPIYGPGSLRHQGRSLIEVSFNITLLRTLTPNLREEIQKIEFMLDTGEFSFLVFGGQVFGDNPYIITEYSEVDKYYNRDLKDFDYVTISLSLKEYIEDLKVFNKNLESKKNNKISLSEENQASVIREQKGVIK